MHQQHKVVLFVFTILIAIATSRPACAYDVDTHFYATYSMTRSAAIRHEVAARIALGAERRISPEPADIYRLDFLIREMQDQSRAAAPP